MTPTETLIAGSRQIETPGSASPRIRTSRASRTASQSLNPWLDHWVLIGLTLFVSGYILLHPLATNDGPVHTAFSHLILTYHQADHPLQQQAYTLNVRPNPNLFVYFLMAGLMSFLSPALTESIIQVLCVVFPIAGAYFALKVINPRSVWLAIFILPMTLNQMFFLGLYNHEIAMGAFFLVIGLWFWLAKAPSWPRAAALSGALILTFFCHASGFVMASTGLGMMAAVSGVLGFRRILQATPSFTAAFGPVLRRHGYAIAAMLPPVPVVLYFLTSGGKNPIDFGPPVWYRLDQFVKLHLLAVNYPYRDRFPAFAISGLLIAAFLIVTFRIFYRHAEWTPQRRDQAIGLVAATLLAVFIMCIFPDVMAGGWTHFRRFQIYPFYWMLLTLSFENFSARLAGLYFTVASAASAALIASMIGRQVIIRHQLEPLAQVDQLIGNHCSVAPLTMERHLVDNQKIPDWMEYQPFFQSPSSLELHGDRVVLFNYLARLNPYPVHFRPTMEPQTHLYLWKSQQIENDIEKIDLRGYESGSSLKVDYILLWGTPERSNWSLQHQIHNALTGFTPIYHSAGNWVTLYQRQSGLNPVCTATPLSR